MCLEVCFLPCIFIFGELATVFPGISTVESDFSVLQPEKCLLCSQLSDLSLEGISQTKHYSLVN